MAGLTEPDWDDQPEAEWFYPETEEQWASYYRMEQGKLFRKVMRHDTELPWREINRNGGIWNTFWDRLENGQLLTRPGVRDEPIGENSWLMNL